MKTHLRILFVFVLALSSCQTPAPRLASAPAVAAPDRAQFEKIGTHFAVATQGEESSRIGLEVLKKGGTVVDAAIAVSFAISVERPQSTGIGGGGFLIYYDAKKKKSYVLDFRDQAAAAAKPDMFLDANGNANPELSTKGGLAIAVPGLVEGMRVLHAAGFSKKSFSELVRPARTLAEKGVAVSPHLAKAIEVTKDDLLKDEFAKRVFFKADGTPLKAGDRLIQPELGRTLARIAISPRDFYTGATSRETLKTLKEVNSPMTARDFTNYQAKERRPLEGSFMASGQKYEVISMPPPSSGGVHVLQFLKMMELAKINDRPRFDAQTLHLMSQAFQQVYADRAKFMGDPDFVKIPRDSLISEEYLAQKVGEFTSDRARKMNEISAGVFPGYEKDDTTHFSIMDKDGNAVVSTQSVNGYFGSRIFVKGAGYLLNNGMDDFSQKAGVLNLFGAVGSKKNLPEPGKRPLSSMSPTIVLKNGKPVLALGCPNGTRIISGVAQVILNEFFFGMDLYGAVSAPRIHHQWQPDQLWLEEGVLTETVQKPLEKLGYSIKPHKAQNFIQAIGLHDGHLTSVSDPRDVAGARAE